MPITGKMQAACGPRHKKTSPTNLWPSGPNWKSSVNKSPSTLEYLFTYGTLQEKQVQQDVFGHLVEGHPDALLGFKKMENAVYGQYPLVMRTADAKDKVKGTVYKVTITDLEKADVYESNAYKRVKFPLESGLEAWVYIENSQ
ncbi:gamma-glutamylcyclotransferase [Flagellimonas taeanensis]|nr:gamma-glutamylcyclotransferase [Allomuricauda taeanensis]